MVTTTFKGKYVSFFHQITGISPFHWQTNPALLLRNLDISETSIFAFAESLLEPFGDERLEGPVDFLGFCR